MLLNEAHQRRLLSHARYLKAQSEKQIQTAQGNSKKTAILASQTNKAYQASLELMWILQIQLENEQVEHCQAELMYTDYVHHQSDFLTHLKQSHSLMTTKFSEFASSQKDNIDEAGYAALEELAGVLSATSLFSNDKITQLESALHAWKTTRKDMHGSHESEFSQNLAKLMECADIARNFLDGLSLTPGAKETGTSDISDAVEDSSDILDQSRPNSCMYIISSFIL